MQILLTSAKLHNTFFSALQLERARLVGGDYSENRIGKSAWLRGNIDIAEKLRRRTADFTGLSMSYAEPLQVLNYGIGGHYDWHYDAFDVIMIHSYNNMFCINHISRGI